MSEESEQNNQIALFMEISGKYSNLALYVICIKY